MLAISGGKVSFSKREKVPIVGILWRENIMEKCFLAYSETDPKPLNITDIVSKLTEEKYFTEKQIKIVLIFNSILAGLGILDLAKLQDTWNVPIIVISEEEPNNEKIVNIIQELKYDEEYKKALQKNPQNWKKLKNSRIFLLPLGLSNSDAEMIIKNLQLVGDIPEPLRIADMIAKTIH